MNDKTVAQVAEEFGMTTKMAITMLAKYLSYPCDAGTVLPKYMIDMLWNHIEQ